MNTLSFTQSEHTRKELLHFIQNSLNPELWRSNACAIGELKLPPGTTIGAIVRGEEVLIAHDSTVIQQDDHVVMFLVDKKHIQEVERLFQPSPFFL